MRSDLARYLFVMLAGVMPAAAAPASADETLVFSSRPSQPERRAPIHAFQLDSKTGSLTPVHRTTDVESVLPGRVAGPEVPLLDPRPKVRREGTRRGRRVRDRWSNRPVEAIESAVIPRLGVLLSGGRCDQQDAARRQLLDWQRGVAARAGRWVVGRGGVVHSTCGLERRSGPPDEVRTHSIVVSPENRFRTRRTWGSTRWLIYRLDAAKATLSPNQTPLAKTPPGGPRHLTFHPNGKYLYAINELGNSVTLFDYDPRSGAAPRRQTDFQRCPRSLRKELLRT